MNSKKFKAEYLLYALAFVIGLFIRMYRLGDFPLNDNEAQWALMAFNNLGETPLLVGSQPGYVLFTSILFNVLMVLTSSRAFSRLLQGACWFSPPYYSREISVHFLL